MHQYAHLQARVDLSTPYHRWNGTRSMSMSDKSIKVGGTQKRTTPDGFIILLDMQHGLPYLNMAATLH